MRILLTRPLHQGDRAAALLRARGHHVLHVPLLRIEPNAHAEIGPGPWAALVMTSANAAYAIGRHKLHSTLLDRPVFAVGDRTAAAARAAWFTQVTAAEGGVDALAKLVTEKIPAGDSILYLAGEDRAGDLGGILDTAGYAVTTVIIYRAVAESVLPDAVSRAITTSSLDTVLHFSRRSAATFLTLAAAGSCLVNVLKYNHFCLSAQVAEPLLAAGAARVAVATRPEEAALVDLVGTAE